MKIWDEFGTEPIDHEVIKLQFFRKVHTKNPPFRSKLKPKPRDEVDVPEIVRHHYENPPSLLPSLRDVLRVDNLRKRGTVHVDSVKDDVAQAQAELDCLDTARKRLKTIFSDQEDVHGLLVEPEEDTLNKSKDHMKRSKRSKSLAKELETSTEEIKIETTASETSQEETVMKVSENSQEIFADGIKIEAEAQQTATPLDAADSTPSILLTSELQAINEQLCHLTEDTIKLLAFQRLQQIVNENPNYIQKFQDKSTASPTIAEIAKCDQRFPIPLLPSEIKDEFGDSKTSPVVRMSDRPFHIRSEGEKAHSVALSLERPIIRSKIRSRAVLTFANDYLSGKVWFSVAPTLNLSVYMRYRSFAIGYGADNDLDLSKFGECAFVSPKHAVLFFDEVTKHFELLNYSNYGSEVNGQLYCCDFTEHPSDYFCEAPASPLKDKRVAIQSKIKNMLDAKKKIREGIDKAESDVV